MDKYTAAYWILSAIVGLVLAFFGTNCYTNEPKKKKAFWFVGFLFVIAVPILSIFWK